MSLRDQAEALMTRIRVHFSCGAALARFNQESGQ